MAGASDLSWAESEAEACLPSGDRSFVSIVLQHISWNFLVELAIKLLSPFHSLSLTIFNNSIDLIILFHCNMFTVSCSCSMSILVRNNNDSLAGTDQGRFHATLNAFFVTAQHFVHALGTVGCQTSRNGVAPNDVDHLAQLLDG